MFIVFANPRSVAAHVLLLLGGVVALVVVMSLGLASLQASRQVREVAAARVVAIAETIAATDDVQDAVVSADPAGALGALIERERQRTGTDFIVVMSPDGVRYTHPNPDLVGGTFIGTIEGARAGGIVVEDYTGTLGPSTRAVVPVLIDGQVRALVSVGIHRDRVDAQLVAALPRVLLPGLGVALVSAVGAWMVAHRVRRETLGLGAVELGRLHDHHEAVLHSIREGLVIADADGIVQVVNDEAQRLLGLGPDAVGRRVADLGLPDELARVLVGDEPQVDAPHATGGRVLLLSSDTVRRQGRAVSTLTTLRDRTELEEVTGRLTSTRSLADALHAQAHEAANRLHTVVTLIELGRSQEALRFATDELRTLQEHSAAVLAAIEEPALAALLLGKMSQASERGVALTLDPDAHLPVGVVAVSPLVTILGNLIDNALDAVEGVPAGAERSVVVDVQEVEGRVMVTVSDSGPGLDAEARAHAFERGWTTKDAAGAGGRGIGLTLVAQTVSSLGGMWEVTDPPGATFTVVLPSVMGGRDG